MEDSANPIQSDPVTQVILKRQPHLRIINSDMRQSAVPALSEDCRPSERSVTQESQKFSIGKMFNWLLCCCSTAKEPETHKVVGQKNLREFIQQRRSKKVRTIISQPTGCQKTLVLDLDQTLVHSGDFLQKWDFQIQFQHEGTTRCAYTKMRTGLQTFLSTMSHYYELIVFTAGVPDLANKILDRIDPAGLIKHRIFRQHCIEVQFSNKIYLKNLNLLNRKLENIVLLDVIIVLGQNSRNSGLLNVENLLVIGSFYQDSTDQELVGLMPFLVHLSGLKDVRNVEQHRQQYDEMYQPALIVPQERKRTLKLKTVRMDVQLLTITNKMD